MIVAIAVLIFSALDAWRDAWLSKNWWPRHLAKWAGFFGQIGFILWQAGWLAPKMENVNNLILLAAFSFIIWRMIYRLLTSN